MSQSKKPLRSRKESKPHPVDVHVGGRIRQFRMRRKMSQMDLAKQIGVQYQQIQQYEHARKRVPANRLQMIAKVLGVEVRNLFGGRVSEASKKAGSQPPKKKQPCTIDGVHYKSGYAATKALGISIGKLLTRLQSSNFPEYVSKHHPKRHTRGFVPCSVAGVEYKSIGYAARDLGIHYNEMTHRLVSPDYPDCVCEKRPKRPPKAFKYEVKGKQYKTLQEAANVEGVTKERIRQRLNDPSYTNHQRL